MSTSNQDNPERANEWMDRPRFLREYKLKLDLEFSQDGNAAEWAHNGHRFWDAEDDSIKIERDDEDKKAYPDASAALSPDNRFLAISTNKVIRIYGIKSKQVVSELRAHEGSVDRMYFAPRTADGSGAAYTLVSSGERMYPNTQTFIWHLEETGAHYGPKKMLPGEVPHFGVDNPVSSDGQRLITIENNQSTQQGMRPLEEMPKIVVRSIDTLAEEWRLTGHQDAIMWAGWSPDDKWIAEASWDQTYGIWDPKVRDRASGHLVGPSNGQNWVGAFSADSKYILFSGGRPTKVAVYKVATGEEVCSLKERAFNLQGHWMREVQWSPVDYSIALVVDQKVVIWRPLEGESATSVLEIKTDGTLLTRFNSLLVVKWIDGGRKIVVKDTANTVFVWDVEENKKWRFQRPDGLGLDVWTTEVLFVKEMGEHGTILSLDGDWKVRCWKL